MFERSKNFEWNRYGDVNKDKFIALVNPNAKATIRGITFSLSENDISLQLRLSALEVPSLLRACEKHFDRTDYQTYGAHQGIIDVNFDIEVLPKLLSFFKDLDKGKEKKEFSPKFLVEIKQLFNYLHNKPGQNYKHILSEGLFISPYTNPSLEGSNYLINAVKKPKVGSLFHEIHRGLSRGENPNQTDKHGLTLLFLVMCSRDVELLKLILVYGGNPFIPNGTTSFASVTDFAIFNKDSKVLDVIQQQFTPLHKLTITNIEFNESSNQVETLYTFSNGTTIKANLFDTEQITQNQKDDLLKLYSIPFESCDPEQKIDKLFIQDISGKNKFVRILSNDTGVVGFLIYEWIKLKKNNNQRVIHNVCSSIDLNFRGNGLMTLLSFDIALGIQLITDDLKIATYFGAIHFNSNRVVQTLYFPKYRAKPADNAVSELLEILHNKPILLPLTTNFQIDEALKVKGSYWKNPENIFEWFFNVFQLEVSLLKEKQSKLVPTFFYHGSEAYNQLVDSVGYDLSDYFNKLARKILKCLTKEVTNFLDGKVHPPIPVSDLEDTRNTFYGPKSHLRSGL